jgi:hypothetical protein
MNNLLIRQMAEILQKLLTANLKNNYCLIIFFESFSPLLGQKQTGQITDQYCHYSRYYKTVCHIEFFRKEKKREQRQQNNETS